MANRSYLFAIDFDRTKDTRKKGEKIYGLSEANHLIPLSYKILVSQDCQLSHSINWEYEHPIAIQGNFEQGKQKLLSYLRNLQQKGLFQEEELNNQINETKAFLEQHQLQNILLEAGEIYEMEEGSLEDKNKALFENEILHIDDIIEEYNTEFRSINKKIDWILEEKDRLMEAEENNAEQLGALKQQYIHYNSGKWRLLGINYWSDVLYYHFKNE